MSRSSYSHGICFLCGKDVSNSGLASTSHKRMHVREGLMVERPAYNVGRDWFNIRFDVTKKGVAYGVAIRKDRQCQFATRSGKDRCPHVATYQLKMADGSTMLACANHRWSDGSTDSTKLPKFVYAGAAMPE